MSFVLCLSFRFVLRLRFDDRTDILVDMASTQNIHPRGQLALILNLSRPRNCSRRAGSINRELRRAGWLVIPFVVKLSNSFQHKLAIKREPSVSSKL